MIPARKQAVAQILPDSGEEWGGFGMPVITVASPVAESGRTTLAAHLAVEAGRTGNGPVVLLDPVPGGALTAWLAKRKRPTPEGHPANFELLGGKLFDLEHAGTQLCIVETLSTRYEDLKHPIALADIVVIPCPLEKKALKAAAKFADKVRKSGAAATVVVTRPPPGEEFWNPITRKLKAEGMLCPAVLHHDGSIESAMAEGLTAAEAGGQGTAQGDIGQIWQALANALPQPPRRPRWTASAGPRPGVTFMPGAPGIPLIEEDIRVTSPMRTICVLGEGDGTDSAIFTANLAIQSIRSGAASSRVTILETAANGVLVDWRLARGGGGPILWETPMEDLEKRLPELRDNHTRYCFVHIAPERIPEVLQVLEASDLLVLPVRCDRPDKEIGGTVEALQNICGHHAYGGPAVAGVVLRAAEARGARAKAMAALKGAGIFRLQWDDEMEEAMRAGSTVMEDRPTSLAAREFVEVWAGLRKLMGGK